MENATLKKKHADQLIFLGVLLFLLGLVTGLVVPVFTNPRLGVSSHIEGVLNGIFLIVLGLIWHKVNLPGRWLNIGFWLALYGTFINWLGILIAAIFNAGHSRQWQRRIAAGRSHRAILSRVFIHCHAGGCCASAAGP